MDTYNTKSLMSLRDRIEKFDKQKQIKILSLLKKNEKDIELNENKSGVLINLIDLKNETLKEIFEYVENTEKYETYFNNIENKKEEFRRILEDKNGQW